MKSIEAFVKVLAARDFDQLASMFAEDARGRLLLPFPMGWRRSVAGTRSSDTSSAGLDLRRASISSHQARTSLGLGTASRGASRSSAKAGPR